ASTASTAAGTSGAARATGRTLAQGHHRGVGARTAAFGTRRDHARMRTRAGRTGTRAAIRPRSVGALRTSRPLPHALRGRERVVAGTRSARRSRPRRGRPRPLVTGPRSTLVAATGGLGRLRTRAGRRGLRRTRRGPFGLPRARGTRLPARNGGALLSRRGRTAPALGLPSRTAGLLTVALRAHERGPPRRAGHRA